MSDLGGSLAQLMRASTRFRNAVVTGECDFPSLLVLVNLEQHGPMRVMALTDHVLMDQSVVSRSVASLTDSGFITRDVDPTDRRASIVSITEKGRSVVDSHRERRNSMVESATKHWSAQDKATLAALAARFADDLSSYMQDNKENS